MVASNAPVQLFATSPRLSPKGLVAFRALSATLLLGHQVAHAAYWATMFGGKSWFYLLYITHWTMILATLSEWLLFVLALRCLGDQPDKAKTKTAQSAQLLWQLVQPSSMIIVFLSLVAWALADQRPELKSFTYLDFYAHGLICLWLLLSGFLSYLPFSMCTGFCSTVSYSLLYVVWTLIHFWAKIGTPEPCEVYAQQECPIYSDFDWHKPQNATIKVVGVCFVVCPLVCGLCAFLVRCRGSQAEAGQKELDVAAGV